MATNVTNVLRRTREIFVATESFQTWIGLDLTDDIADRKAAARNRVYRWFLPDWSKADMPCILLFPDGYEGTRQSMGGGSFRFTQGVQAVFFDVITSSETGDYDSRVSEIETFDDTTLAITQEMLGLSGSSDHIFFGTGKQAKPPVLNGWDVIDPADPSRSDVAGFDYICTVWAFEGLRFGETGV